jgi:hypothetical protein
MNTATFIVEAIKALAWPVATVVAVVLLRRSLATVIPGLKRLKVKGVEMEFEREVSALKAESGKLLPPKAETEVETTGRFLRLVVISPRAAVLEAWRQLESAAVASLAFRGELQPQDRTTLVNLIESLRKSAILNEDQRILFNGLRALRNLAVHGEIGQDSAVDYVRMASQMIKHFREFTQSSQPPGPGDSQPAPRVENA